MNCRGSVAVEFRCFINGDYNFARRGRVYAFANGRLQQDRIQDLDLRSILGGGLGYLQGIIPSDGRRWDHDGS